MLVPVVQTASFDYNARDRRQIGLATEEDAQVLTSRMAVEESVVAGNPTFGARCKLRHRAPKPGTVERSR